MRGGQLGLVCAHTWTHMHTPRITLQGTHRRLQALLLGDEAHEGLGQVSAGSRTKVPSLGGGGVAEVSP